MWSTDQKAHFLGYKKKKKKNWLQQSDKCIGLTTKEGV